MPRVRPRVRSRRADPSGPVFTDRGTGPPPPLPPRPDGPPPPPLDHVTAGMFLPPPRADHLPQHVAARVRAYVRRRVWRPMLVMFGLLLLGVAGGLATTIGMSRPHAISQGRLYSGNLPADFTVLGIFTHNVLIVLVPLALFPLLFWGPGPSAAATGFLVGRLTGIWQALHLPTGELIAALIPHGVIEVPSILLGGTLAWRIGLASWDSARFGGSWWLRTRSALLAALPVVAVVVAALAVAATIEVKVTPDLVRALYG